MSIFKKRNGDYILTFGKYKDMSLYYILDNDPSYILWLDENNVLENIDEDVLAEAEELSEELSDNEQF